MACKLRKSAEVLHLKVFRWGMADGTHVAVKSAYIRSLHEPLSGAVQLISTKSHHPLTSLRMCGGRRGHSRILIVPVGIINEANENKEIV